MSQVRGRRDNAELLAAIATHDVTGSHDFTQPLSNFLEHAITCRMAVRVVDKLKSVHIYHDAAKCLVVARSPGPSPIELFKQRATTIAAGQDVRHRENL